MIVATVLLADRGACRLAFAFCAAAEVVTIRAFLCSSLIICGNLEHYLDRLLHCTCVGVGLPIEWLRVKRSG